MNEIIKAMKERRSTRNFKPEMPAKEDIDQIVEAGLYAANAMGEQKVITVVVTNKELRDKLSKVNHDIGGFPEGMDPFYGAPVVIIVLAEKDWPMKVNDGSLCIGNMLLAAHSLGLGSVWVHRAKEEFDMPEYQQILKDLGVDGDWEGIGHCVIGYTDEKPEAAPRKDGRVYWVE